MSAGIFDFPSSGKHPFCTKWCRMCRNAELGTLQLPWGWMTCLSAGNAILLWFLACSLFTSDHGCPKFSIAERLLVDSLACHKASQPMFTFLLRVHAAGRCSPVA